MGDGCRNGIGKAAAVMFAREGAAVALIGRRRDRLEEVAATIKASGGSSVVPALDVAEREPVVKEFYDEGFLPYNTLKPSEADRLREGLGVSIDPGGGDSN